MSKAKRRELLLRFNKSLFSSHSKMFGLEEQTLEIKRTFKGKPEYREIIAFIDVFLALIKEIASNAEKIMDTRELFSEYMEQIDLEIDYLLNKIGRLLGELPRVNGKLQEVGD